MFVKTNEKHEPCKPPSNRYLPRDGGGQTSVISSEEPIRAERATLLFLPIKDCVRK